jgi:large subunit ribosomal protein L23
MFILAPLKTEKYIQLIEFQNTVGFLVDQRATKDNVKKEVEQVFNVKVASVRTYVTPKGDKHALVKLAAGSKAEDIANKLKLA